MDDLTTGSEVEGGLHSLEAFLLYLLFVFLVYLAITVYFAGTEKNTENRLRRRLHRHSLRDDSQGGRNRSDLLDSRLESDILKDLFKTDGIPAKEGSSTPAGVGGPPATVNELIIKAVEDFKTEKKTEKKAEKLTTEKKTEKLVEKTTEKKAEKKIEKRKRSETNLGAGSDYDWMEFLKTSDDSKTSSDLSPDCLLAKGEAELSGRPIKPARRARSRSRSSGRSSSGFRKTSK